MSAEKNAMLMNVSEDAFEDVFEESQRVKVISMPTRNSTKEMPAMFQSLTR